MVSLSINESVRTVHEKAKAFDPSLSCVLDIHPLRDVLTNEVHARPFAALSVPEQASHLAVVSNEDGAPSDHAQLVALCERHGVPAPQDGLNHFSQDFGMFRLKWERHTEFTTYTFFESADGATFDNSVIRLVPPDWLAELPRVLVAVNISVSRCDASEINLAELASRFVQTSLIGSQVAGGLGSVFADYRIHADGFGRILILDHGLSNQQAGRLVQNLLEIETYRMMALLGLPLARQAAPDLVRIERGLVEIAAQIGNPRGQHAERRLLDHLSGFAGEIERLAAWTSYRFSAARAYSAIVDDRIVQLREKQVLQLQTIGEFMERRLLPAIRTCTSTGERIERLSKRVARAGQLLRTRIDVVLEAQNRDLLRSVNRRIKLQLLLQHMVEGLSVTAISYYLVGLIGYAAKATEVLRLPIKHDLVSGIAVIVVPAAVWWTMRRVRCRLFRRTQAANLESRRPPIVENS